MKECVTWVFHSWKIHICIDNLAYVGWLSDFGLRRKFRVNLAILCWYPLHFYTYNYILFQFSRWKTVFCNPKLVSLPVCNMFNQILPKLAIMFLFAPFKLQLIHFFLILIFKVKKNCFFHPKLYLFLFGTCSTKFCQIWQ